MYPENVNNVRTVRRFITGERAIDKLLLLCFIRSFSNRNGAAYNFYRKEIY